MGKKATANASSTSNSSTSKSKVEDTTNSIPKPQQRNPRAKIVRSGNAGNSSSAKPKDDSAIVPDDGRPPPLFPVGRFALSATPSRLLKKPCHNGQATRHR